MSQVFFAGKLTPTVAYPLSESSFYLEATFEDPTGASNGNMTEVGDFIFLDTSTYTLGTVSRYKISSISYKDATLLQLEISWEDTSTDIISPEWALGFEGLISRGTPKRSFSTTYHLVSPLFSSMLRNMDFWEKLDDTGTGSAFNQWVIGKSYAAGDIVSYRNILFRASAAHTSSVTFGADLNYWDSLDPIAKIRYKAIHGVPSLSAVYLAPSTFYVAKADSQSTLGTHIVLDTNASYALLVNSGDYYIPGHGLSGVRYVSPSSSGATTNVEPDPAQYYINPVMVIEDPDWISVVANQPAYKK